MQSPAQTYESGAKRTSEATSVTDDALWGSLKIGNELSFSLLYNRYVQRLYNYGMHACNHREMVKDSIQELFIRLWDRRETLGVAGSVSFYLFKSFRRLLIQKIIARKRFSVPFSKVPESQFEFIPSAEQQLMNQEVTAQQSARIAHLLKGLAKRQREAIYLKFYNELSYHEVSSIMDLKVESVYNLISRAVEILRQRLKEVAPFLVFFLTF